MAMLCFGCVATVAMSCDDDGGADINDDDDDDDDDVNAYRLVTLESDSSFSLTLLRSMVIRERETHPI